MSPLSKKIFIGLEVAVHLAIFFGAFAVGSNIRHSDSLVTQISPDTVPNIGFSLYKFNINGTIQDIEFSHEQEDEFGNEWRAAKTNYWVWHNFTVVFFSIPAVLFLIGLLRKQNKKGLFVNMIRRVARVTLPVAAVSTILMSITLAMLMRSNLCGPNYMELGYQIQQHHYHHHDDDDDDDYDYIGTNSTVRSDVPVRCELGDSGVGTAVLMGLLPLVLIGQGLFLNRRANQLESWAGEEETEVREAERKSSYGEGVGVAKVYDNDDEKTVASKQSDRGMV